MAELSPSAQRCMVRFLLGILIFKGLTARRLYKSFGFKGLNRDFVYMFTFSNCCKTGVW
jgi:hypothetical protein